MAERYEYYITGDDADLNTLGATWIGQTFTPVTAHKIKSVKLLLYRIGLPGTITVSIKATDGSGHPTGLDLCVGTTNGNTLPTGAPYEWREITLGAGYDLVAYTKYAIVVRVLGGSIYDYLRWRVDTTSPTYPGGWMVASTDWGNSWTSYTGMDCLFEEWGEPPITPKTSSDSGSGTDAKKTGEPKAAYARSETGGGIDGHKALAPQSAGESGSGVDALTSLLGILARSDTGLGTDAKLSLAVALIKADAGSGIDALIGRAIVLAELGAGLEHILDRALVLTDLGSGLDTTLRNKVSSDSGVGSDAILALLDRIFTEYGYGVDASIWGDRPLLASDTGLGVESSLLRELGEPKYSSDDGSGIDASTLASLFTRADSGLAKEAIALLAAILAGDNGQGIDALVEVTATFKDIITSDAGQGVEAVLSYLRKLVDSGEGEENLHLVGVVGRRMRMKVYQRQAFDLKAYTSETGK